MVFAKITCREKRVGGKKKQKIIIKTDDCANSRASRVMYFKSHKTLFLMSVIQINKNLAEENGAEKEDLVQMVWWD